MLFSGLSACWARLAEGQRQAAAATMMPIFSLALAVLVVLLIESARAADYESRSDRKSLWRRAGVVTYYDENGTGSSPGVD